MHFSVPWLFDGFQWKRDICLNWENDSIVGMEPSSSEAPEYLKNCILIPGLVNLHSHLELSDLKGALPRGVSFPEWVTALQSITKTWSEQDFEASFNRGLQECIETGTTTILDVGNSGVGQLFSDTPGVRLLSRQELIGLDPKVGMDRFKKAKERVQSPAGLCAHAPYSCSPRLIQAVVQDCNERVIAFTMHFAESREEVELYRLAKGRFRNWIDGFCKDHIFQSPHGGAWNVAKEIGVPEGSILVHGNFLNHEEKYALKEHGCILVHCPQSARWFGHHPLNVKECIRMGLPVALGTDSLGSAESLSLWDQMHLLWTNEPDLSCSEILSAVTGIPGCALDASGRFGQLKENANADLLLLELPDASDPTQGDWIRTKEFRIRAKVVAGKLI